MCQYSLSKSNKNSFYLLALLLIVFSCKPKSFDVPKISLDQYQVEQGFDLQVAASEPFLEAPISMDFDNQGRMWVVEMKGFMLNLENTGADMPNGVISIMEDLDGDGVTDHSKIFIDNLVLPRAIAHVYGGLLYAEPPSLWFVDIENDKPINKTLIDSLYSDGGNVEHQPNGLMMHLDNWIYNAKSNFRYQRKNGKWKKEPTSFRGQWGISKDNFGRIYYNNNTSQLMGDYVLPNTTIKNPYYKPTASLNKTLTKDQRVYPLHPTLVNRGYQKGVLDKDSLLINVTSACGPLIYRGNKFPESYDQNAFVCAPEANLIKRNILTFKTDIITAKQAVENIDFIASTDAGFRPVNLFNGPDGNIYVVDMHRGIIQDKAFLTPYLKNQTAKKQLDTIVGMGRILRIVPENYKHQEFRDLEQFNVSELIELLNHSNGWLRDRAQQLLIYKNDQSAIPGLEELSINSKSPLAQIHALHTLNGLDKLSFNLLEQVLNSNSESSVISHALVLSESYASSDLMASFLKIVQNLSHKNNAEIDLYTLSSLGSWLTISVTTFFPKVLELSNRYNDNLLYQEAIVNSLRGNEDAFMLYLENDKIEISTKLSEILETTLSNKSKEIKNSVYTLLTVGTDSRTSGYKIFRNLCATCHGVDGDGIEGLAPPLKNSEYVTQSSKKLALVVLHGMSGPIHVNNKLYDLKITMPGLANNQEFTDEDILDLISYMHNAFPGKNDKISVEDIKLLRTIKPVNGVFTEKELLKLKY